MKELDTRHSFSQCIPTTYLCAIMLRYCLCLMIWGQRWLFILLILVECVKHHCINFRFIIVIGNHIKMPYSLQMANVIIYNFNILQLFLVSMFILHMSCSTYSCIKVFTPIGLFHFRSWEWYTRSHI
jgi:hypothetical protein